MIVRQAFGYIVEIDGHEFVANLAEEVRSHVAGHAEGVSSFEHPGDLIAVEGGSLTIVCRVQSISFAEPRELHRSNGKQQIEPLRQLRGHVLGCLKRKSDILEFQARNTIVPALGAKTFPLSADELRATLCSPANKAESVKLGMEARNQTLPVHAPIDNLLSRHVAVLGSTGQGKTHFVADILQQLSELPKSRIIVFDLNGEYYPAFEHLGERVKYTAIGDRQGRNAPVDADAPIKIPYYALGRHGLFRLLLPSEKTQAPALRFAIEHLPFIEADESGAKLPGEEENCLFDDCRTAGARSAFDALESIKRPGRMSHRWPHMKGISCLVAENYTLKQGRNGIERSVFDYGHISSLVSRVNSLISDSRFTAVVDVAGGGPAEGGLDLNAEAEHLVSKIFGPSNYFENDPAVRIIDLSQLTQDLMPFVLGSILEMFAEQLFRRGTGGTHPTMLVLEEAHHYMRQASGDPESGQNALAYERLAKEGRKFGVSLLVSTQRPSEVAPTVLAQCGSWAVFRLTNEVDKRSVSAAAEDSGLRIVEQLAGLARGEAMLFGAAFPMPIRISREPLPDDRKPDSIDPPFVAKWS